MKDQLEALIMQMYKSNILYSEAVREFKKRFILTVLQENKGNQCRAARELGMHRNTLSRAFNRSCPIVAWERARWGPTSVTGRVLSSSLTTWRTVAAKVVGSPVVRKAKYISPITSPSCRHGV